MSSADLELSSKSDDEARERQARIVRRDNLIKKKYADEARRVKLSAIALAQAKN